MVLATVGWEAVALRCGRWKDRIGDGWPIPDVSVLWPGQRVIGDYLCWQPDGGDRYCITLEYRTPVV